MKAVTLMSDSWWSRQLGNSTPAPQTSTPPVSPPVRGGIRIPAVVQQPQAVAVQTHMIQQQVLDPQRDPQSQISMGDAIRLWQGGEAHKRDGGNCPECGSHLYFSRSKGATVNGASPAPRCYSCGYNERYTQAEQSNWV